MAREPAASYLNSHEHVKVVATKDYTPGELTSHAGKPAVVEGLDPNALKTGDTISKRLKGQFKVKTNGTDTFTAGDTVNFNFSAQVGQVAAGDIAGGIAVHDSAAGEPVVVLLGES